MNSIDRKRSKQARLTKRKQFGGTVTQHLTEAMDNPMKLSMGQAAKHINTSKATLSRAIKDGRLSADRREDGSYEIDPSELERYKAAALHRLGRETPETVAVKRSTTHPETPVETGSYSPILEAQLEALKSVLIEKDRRISDLETDRDRWAQQAERATLLLTNNAPKPASASLGGFWPFRRKVQAANG